MKQELVVDIPSEKGKISKQTTKFGTYIHYVLERTYDPKKKHTVPKRVLIGKRCLDDETKMYPNEKFFEYFPDAAAVAVPQGKPSKQSSSLQIGSYGHPKNHQGIRS